MSLAQQGAIYYAGAIKRAHERGETPFTLRDKKSVRFKIHDQGPWGCIYLFECGEVTTAGKNWQSISKQSLYDFVEAETGVRPAEPEKLERPAKRARKST